MSLPADINVVTGASVAPEEWSSSALDWDDPYGARAAASAAAESGEPQAKHPRVVFPPGQEPEQQQGASQAVDTITVDSSPSDRISPEHFDVSTPEGSGSQRTPTLPPPASCPTERSDAGGSQQGGLANTATQQSYHAYNGLERELLSGPNAQAFGVGPAAPTVLCCVCVAFVSLLLLRVS